MEKIETTPNLMKPNNTVQMEGFVCTNVEGVEGEPCELYPKTHVHVKEG